MKNTHIPLVDLVANYHSLQKQMDKKILEVVSSGRYSQGKYVEEFEKDFAKYIGVKHCVGVGSGTEALHLSLMALNIGPGDEVIVPANSFVATAYAAIYVGAKPVLVDVDPDTSNLAIDLIEEKITKKTKVIIPVHLYGQVCQMDAIIKLAKKYKLAVLEDACQSHGALFKDKRAGSLGNLATFSFYPAKNLGAYGDAGAITTNSFVLAKRIKKLREYGSTKKYYFQSLGFNSRLDALQAAVLNTKLKHLNNWNKKRREIADYYTKRLQKEIVSIKVPKINKDAVYHLYVIETSNRNGLMSYLANKGVQTGIHYPLPLHLQKSLTFLGYKKGDFPVAEKLSSRILSLPLYPEITRKQQNFVIDNIKVFFNK